MLTGLVQIEPFNKLSKAGRELLKDSLRWREYKIGDRIYRQDEMPSNVSFIINGEVRLLGKSFKDNSLITLKKIAEGSLVGWAGLLRGEACETIQASKNVELISIPSEVFVRLILTEDSFKKYLELYPDGYNSLDSMAEFFMFEKNFDEAKKYYEKVLNVFPFSNSARSSLNDLKNMK